MTRSLSEIAMQAAGRIENPMGVHRPPVPEDIQRETAEKAIAALNGELERVVGLLGEACGIIAGLAKESGGEPGWVMSEDLREWWASNREPTLEERARSVLLSVPDSDVEVLDAYVTDVRDSAAGQHITNILGRLRK